MRTYYLGIMALIVAGFITSPAHAKTSEYNLTIERLPVNVTGKPIEKITVTVPIWPLPSTVRRYGCNSCYASAIRW